MWAIQISCAARAIMLAVLALAVAVAPRHAFGQDTDHFPDFSWDTVPLYAHLGKLSQAFSDEKIAFIAARYDFITIEKAHGLDEHGTSEAGILAAAQRLKTINPDIKVLFDWNVLLDYPFYAAHDGFRNIPSGALRSFQVSWN